jgi:DNA polymerase III subunit delta
MKIPASVATAPVVVVRGADPVLVRDAVVDIDRMLVGDAEREFCVEDLSFEDLLTEDGSVDLGRVVDAAHTPAFLADRRVVVARGLAVLTKKEDVAVLVDYLAEPLATTALVLVWDKPARDQRKTGAMPKSLVTAVEAAGGVIVQTDPGSGKAAAGWLDDALAAEEFQLDAGARTRLADWIGDQSPLLVGILATLRGVYGPGDRLSAVDIEPYLGVEGDVTPWTLTDAIDRGDVAGSLSALRRMFEGGERHPMQVMATLVGHVDLMLGLADAAVTGKDDAAQLLGVHPFRAGKALAQVRRLGGARVGEFVTLVAQADLDLRGTKQWPQELVLEVLVARLASRSAAAGARRR